MRPTARAFAIVLALVLGPLTACAPKGQTMHLMGRFDGADPAGLRFAWPGSAITARFRGTGIAITLIDRGANQLSVTVDERTSVLKTAPGKHDYPLARGLALGEHSITLRKRTETSVGVLQLVALTPQGGALVPSAAPYARRIEVIGDSISCGYGNLGDDASCNFSPDTEDEGLAYGALTAAKLGAAHTTVAWSGRGVFRNFGGDSDGTMPVLWERTLAEDDASRWAFPPPPPDVVVVNLGTNDFWKGDPGPGFEAAYAAFLAKIRARYRSAFVLAALGPLLDGEKLVLARGYITRAVAAQHDDRIAFVEFRAQTAADGYGCDYHPNLRTHARMAEQLAAEIRRRTAW